MEDTYASVPDLLSVPVPSAFSQQLLPKNLAELYLASAAPVHSTAPHPPSPFDKLANEVSSSTLSVPGVQALVTATSLTLQRSLSAAAAAAAATQLQPSAPEAVESLHFFGVFDGHGGFQAAQHCKETLHQRLADALQPSSQRPPSPSSPSRQSPVSSGASSRERPKSMDGGPSSAASRSVRQRTLSPVQSLSAGSPEAVQTATAGPVQNEDHEEEPSTAQGEDGGPRSLSAPSPLPHTSFASTVQGAFHEAFLRVNSDFGKAHDAGQVGSTAVVVLAGERQLYLANCGDSRAVLSRGGVAVPLTDDHKPSMRKDEVARVQAAGGQVTYFSGARVQGVLDMSRAIGDSSLHPYVIAQPEVTIVHRHPDDELLLLATDGLWDVIGNQDACRLARRCISRAKQRGAEAHEAAAVAARVLTRAALDKGSSDNVTCVVIDLSRDSATGGEGNSCSQDPPAVPQQGASHSLKYR